MVGSAEYGYWAQELAVAVLAKRGENVVLPPPPADEPRPRGSLRPWLIPLGVTAAVGALAGAYLFVRGYRRDAATLHVRQMGERLQAIAATLPPLAARTSNDPTGAGETFAAACAAPLTRIDWREVLGFVTVDAVPPPEAGGLVLPRWTLVVPRRGLHPSELDDRALLPDAVDHFLDSHRDPADDDWAEHLPTQQRLASFRYVAFSRASNVVWPHFTSVVASGGGPVETRIGSATPMTVEGELGHATLEITVVELTTKAVVCHGHLDDVGPTSFVAIRPSSDLPASQRGWLGSVPSESFAYLGVMREFNRAWLESLCPDTWPELCPIVE